MPVSFSPHSRPRPRPHFTERLCPFLSLLRTTRHILPLVCLTSHYCFCQYPLRSAPLHHVCQQALRRPSYDALGDRNEGRFLQRKACASYVQRTNELCPDQGHHHGTSRYACAMFSRYSHWQIFLACASVDLLALMDQTTLAAALTIVSRDLNASSESSWIAGAYFLTSTSCQLLYGRLSDIWSRKVLLVIGIGIFFFGSLASSLAETSLQLIVFRAFTGVGGGGIMTVAQMIVSGRSCMEVMQHTY